jgi:hypothetical protein
MTVTPSADENKPGSRMYPGKGTMRLAQVHDEAVRHFRSGLMRLWQERGRPHPDEMAARTQTPESVFAIFLADTAMTALPSRREVQSLLEGLYVPLDARNGWLERHARLEDDRAELDRRRIERNRAAEGLPPEPRGLEDLVGVGPVKLTGPLAAALKATTVTQLQAALRDLRTHAGLSYARLAAATETVPGDYVLSRSTAHRIDTDPERTPTKDQVKAFAKACGETSTTNLRLWGRAVEQVQRAATTGASPTPPDATEQLEVYRHDVRYVLGKRPDEVVLSELRVRITPKVRRAAEMLLGLGLVVPAFLIPKSNRKVENVKLAMVGIGAVPLGHALTQTRRVRVLMFSVDRMLDKATKLIVDVVPERLWDSKLGRRLAKEKEEESN